MSNMLVSLSGEQLRIAFRYDKSVVERIKQVAGASWDKQRRAWYVPAGNVLRMLREFPEASYDYDVFVAAERAAKRWIADLHRLGVTLWRDGERIVAHGPGVSPVIEDALQERKAWLLPHLPESTGTPQSAETGRTGIVAPNNPETQQDGTVLWDSERDQRVAEAMIRGMENAKREEERKTQIREAMKRRRFERKAEQLDLGL